jgi:hypothetical protein
LNASEVRKFPIFSLFSVALLLNKCMRRQIFLILISLRFSIEVFSAASFYFDSRFNLFLNLTTIHTSHHDNNVHEQSVDASNSHNYFHYVRSFCLCFLPVVTFSHEFQLFNKFSSSNFLTFIKKKSYARKRASSNEITV